MISFRNRRWYSLAGLCGFTLVYAALFAFLRGKLMDVAIPSGVILLLLMIFLALFNARKSFSFLPLMPASTWLQIHVYVGWACVAVFLVHTGLHWPRGAMEIWLAILFFTVSLSGVVGLALSRLLPKKMTDRGGHVTYEMVPKLRRELRKQAEELVVHSVEQTQKSTIADFYVERIERFLLGSRRQLLAHILGSRRHLDVVITRMHALRRYLNEEESEILKKIEKVLLQKNDLEYQYAMHLMLKGWLFVHIPLSFSLLILGVFHAVLAIRFVGG